MEIIQDGNGWPFSATVGSGPPVPFPESETTSLQSLKLVVVHRIYKAHLIRVPEMWVVGNMEVMTYFLMPAFILETWEALYKLGKL